MTQRQSDFLLTNPELLGRYFRFVELANEIDQSQVSFGTNPGQNRLYLLNELVGRQVAPVESFAPGCLAF